MNATTAERVRGSDVHVGDTLTGFGTILATQPYDNADALLGLGPARFVTVAGDEPLWHYGAEITLFDADLVERTKAAS